MAHVCKNHPEASTRKRCYQCRAYICSDCQRIFLGQNYCSSSCIRHALSSQARTLLSSFLPWKTGKKWPALLWHIFSRAGIHIVYLSLFFLIWRSLQQNRPLPVASVPSLPQPTVRDTLPDRSPVTLSEPIAALVTSNIIDIAGEAADNIVVSLLINGKVEAVTISEKGHFGFNKIKLSSDVNEVIVRGLDEHGHISVLEKIVTWHGKPALTISSPDFSRGTKSQKQMALTFDGGSGNGQAVEILNYLLEKKVTCTVFLTGAFMQRYPDLVKRLLQDGHEVGNHTWNHPHLTTFAENYRQDTRPEISKEKLQEELKRTELFFQQLTGQTMSKLWRAPYGEHNAEIRQWAAELGYRHVGWSVANGKSLDALDWIADKEAKGYQSSQQILHRLLSFGRQPDAPGGGIILMHLDSQRIDDPVHRIVPALIDSLQQQGFELVKISQLISG
jgi:peptidoglycan/xylan/chitin deacetylase (PgdA/CDA1 family)